MVMFLLKFSRLTIIVIVQIVIATELQQHQFVRNNCASNLRTQKKTTLFTPPCSQYTLRLGV